MGHDDLAKAIYDASHLTGTFTLRSGVVSHEYFDKYLFESDPKLLARIGEALAPLVPPNVDGLAGLETGGIPLAVILAQVTGLPSLFVRKEAKSYGTAKLCGRGTHRKGAGS
jgi:Orotate phosphoribosyltransferase